MSNGVVEMSTGNFLLVHTLPRWDWVRRGRRWARGLRGDGSAHTLTYHLFLALLDLGGKAVEPEFHLSPELLLFPAEHSCTSAVILAQVSRLGGRNTP